MSALARIATLSGNLNRLNIALASLEARDPHTALGVSGRRIQMQIEDTRFEIAQLRNVFALSRILDKVA